MLEAQANHYFVIQQGSAKSEQARVVFCSTARVIVNGGAGHVVFGASPGNRLYPPKSDISRCSQNVSKV